MAPIAHVLLAPATILTLLLFPMALANHDLAGPDRAGAAFQYLLVCGPRWILLAVVLVVVLRRGGFAWICRSRVTAGIVVFGVHAGAGTLSLISLMTLHEAGAISCVGALVFSLLLPVLVMGYSGFCLRRQSVGDS